MDKPFDTLGSVSPGRETWRFKVRVLRLWNVYSLVKPEQVNSIEMVLIDQAGDKIHASVRPELVHVFHFKINEGDVYKFYYFTVGSESGLYRTTPHPYKVFFEMKTKVQSCENNSIDSYGLSLTTIRDICESGPQHDFLVDAIGLMTGISIRREYLVDGKIIKMIMFEMTDNSGKCECILCGDYVDDLEKMLGNRNFGLPVVVVQFAKIRIFRGNIAIQTVASATRIYVNPGIPEAVSFKNGLKLTGVETSSSIPWIGPHARPSFEEDFLVNHPKISIVDLLEMADDGIYIVGAAVVDFVEGEDWWYPGCSCRRIVSADSGAFYCKQCMKRPFKTIPRFRVKVKVDDGSGQAIFIVFDGDIIMLLGKPCPELVALSKGHNAGYIPPELESLKGKKLLFKIEKDSGGPLPPDGSFKVKRICNDVSIMEAFDSAVAKHDFYVDDGVNVEEEFVKSIPLAEFVDPNTVSLSIDKPGEDIDVSPEYLMDHLFDIGDNSFKGVPIFIPHCLDFYREEFPSPKRSLLAAFSECHDASADSAKIKKPS